MDDYCFQKTIFKEVANVIKFKLFLIIFYNFLIICVKSSSIQGYTINAELENTTSVYKDYKNMKSPSTV